MLMWRITSHSETILFVEKDVKSRLKVVGEVGEEVVVEDFGDAQKQIGVDGGAGEDVVDVSPVAVELAGKPGDCPGLRAVVEYVLYVGANVHICFLFCAKLHGCVKPRQVLLSPFRVYRHACALRVTPIPDLTAVL